jgi:hypothetical protein
MLFEESGDVAPIDFGRFGRRAGEIIANAVDNRRKAQRRGQYQPAGSDLPGRPKFLRPLNSS